MINDGDADDTQRPYFYTILIEFAQPFVHSTWDDRVWVENQSIADGDGIAFPYSTAAFCIA